MGVTIIVMLCGPQHHFALSALRRLDCSHLGRWPRLLHFAPLALKPQVFIRSANLGRKETRLEPRPCSQAESSTHCHSAIQGQPNEDEVPRFYPQASHTRFRSHSFHEDQHRHSKNKLLRFYATGLHWPVTEQQFRSHDMEWQSSSRRALASEQPEIP
jgi:hypothetical protein